MSTTKDFADDGGPRAGVPAAGAGVPGGPASTRVDRWIWAVRLTKTRAAGAAACRGGHVRVNGAKAKPSSPVRVGDEVRVMTEAGLRIVVVRQILLKRVGAAVAAAAIDDRTPPPPPREERPAEVRRDRGAGRPTKRERRQIERLRGY
ncbi:MAG: RNA-binding S4 domain-containing protein [Actinomycetales bacterium]|nr:RNA-binding S4 domain-containing protein [Actinomycetales bacterium]